eukprot:291965-Pleurochrysis_carterae.AAC.2
MPTPAKTPRAETTGSGVATSELKPNAVVSDVVKRAVPARSNAVRTRDASLRRRAPAALRALAAPRRCRSRALCCRSRALLARASLSLAVASLHESVMTKRSSAPMPMSTKTASDEMAAVTGTRSE